MSVIAAEHQAAPVTLPAASVARSEVAKLVNGTKRYRSGETEVLALDDVSLAFERGRFTAVMGPSGSGKSTLMHCAVGLDRLSTGKVFMGGVDLSSLGDDELTRLRRTKVGFVFQAFNLISTLSARENITLPLDLAHRPPDLDHLTQVIEILGLRARLGHRPSELSGGQQQRVAIARALASQPEIIFADEPTGNLDSRSGAEVLALLRRAVREMGQSVVMVTHDPVAASYADRAIFLADGRVVAEQDGPTAESVLDHIRRLGR